MRFLTFFHAAARLGLGNTSYPCLPSIPLRRTRQDGSESLVCMLRNRNDYMAYSESEASNESPMIDSDTRIRYDVQISLKISLFKREKTPTDNYYHDY